MPPAPQKAGSVMYDRGRPGGRRTGWEEVARIGTFADLGISAPILESVAAMGFEEPSPIQVQAIPLLLAGRDVMGQAQTGTGKTAAFAIPALQRCDPDLPGPQVLVLTPTRELALQVAEEVGRLGSHTGLRETAIYGGQPIERQMRVLREGVDLVVGTPGRLLDHLRRGTLRLEHVHTLVLDEGDEMLDMGFITDIEAILQAAPANRLLAIFSATIPAPIRRLAARYMHEPVHLAPSPAHLAAPAISQHYYELDGMDRVEALCRVLDVEAVGQGIVFCRTKHGVDELTAALQARGYVCEAIHGDMAQTARLRALGRFREGRSNLLIATDVAARGLDVEGVTHVINYDIAASPEAHVHRIGRTGRAGRAGIALTLVHPRELKLLRQICQVTQTRIPRRRLPTAGEVQLAARDALRRQLLEILSGDLSSVRGLAEELAEEYPALSVAAAAIKLAAEATRPAGRETAPTLTIRHLDPEGARPSPAGSGEEGRIPAGGGTPGPTRTQTRAPAPRTR